VFTVADAPTVPQERREKLDSLLKTMVDNVYFQPPPKHQMQYPCIRYTLDDIDTTFANNKPYHLRRRYQVTVIDYDPESVIIESVSALPLCLFDRHYTADNLNHFVYTLFF
jgi:hypothetical protein